jgi:hypothetical protein
MERLGSRVVKRSNNAAFIDASFASSINWTEQAVVSKSQKHATLAHFDSTVRHRQRAVSDSTVAAKHVHLTPSITVNFPDVTHVLQQGHLDELKHARVHAVFLTLVADAHETFFSGNSLQLIPCHTGAHNINLSAHQVYARARTHSRQ